MKPRSSRFERPSQLRTACISASAACRSSVNSGLTLRSAYGAFGVLTMGLPCVTTVKRPAAMSNSVPLYGAKAR